MNSVAHDHPSLLSPTNQHYEPNYRRPKASQETFNLIQIQKRQMFKKVDGIQNVPLSSNRSSPTVAEFYICSSAIRGNIEQASHLTPLDVVAAIIPHQLLAFVLVF